MLNGQISDAGYATHLTQIASYFDIVDNAVKTADTNKRYSISTNVSTAPSPPVQENSWTHVHIAPTCDNMCDLYNSYIVAEMKIKVKRKQVNSAKAISKDNCDNTPSIWIGFKDSMHAISQYQIISNGTSVYDQSHALEEGYITSLATPDTVIDRDVFSKCSMKKIDIRRFLPLSSVKYLPAFVGNLELRLKFSTDGMVCCPMPYTDLITDPVKRNKIVTLPSITTSFMPFGEPVMSYISVAKDTSTSNLTVATAEIALEKTGMEITRCNSILCCFGIDDGIYQSLIQRYSGQSLSFPTQTLSFHQMDGKVVCDASGQAGSFNLAITITPRFIDTIFFLFPHKPNHHTCFFNPMFDSVRLYMGGYLTKEL